MANNDAKHYTNDEDKRQGDNGIDTKSENDSNKSDDEKLNDAETNEDAQ